MVQRQAHPEGGGLHAFSLREFKALWEQYLIESDQEVPYTDGFRKGVTLYFDRYFSMSH